MQKYLLHINARILPLNHTYTEIPEEVEEYFDKEELDARTEALKRDKYFYYWEIVPCGNTIKKCIICGKDFKGKINKKTCSTNCRSKLYYRLKHNLPIENTVKPISEKVAAINKAWEEEMYKLDILTSSLGGNFFSKIGGDN